MWLSGKIGAAGLMATLLLCTAVTMSHSGAAVSVTKRRGQQHSKHRSLMARHPSVTRGGKRLTPGRLKNKSNKSQRSQSKKHQAVSNRSNKTFTRRAEAIEQIAALVGNSSLDTCRGLLGTGQLMMNAQKTMRWEPFAKCSMHMYSVQEARECAALNLARGGKNRLVFVGDSTIRLLYVAVMKLFGLYNARSHDTLLRRFHGDYSVNDSSLSLELDFKWHPYIDESWRSRFKNETQQEIASLMVAGSGYWSMKVPKQQIEKSLQNFTQAFRSWVVDMVKLDQFFWHWNTAGEARPAAGTNSTKLVWAFSDPLDKSKVKSNPLHFCLIADLLGITAKYNQAVYGVLAKEAQDVILPWSSGVAAAFEVKKKTGDAHIDCVHVNPTVNYIKAQILLNLYCNEQKKYEDGTCCDSTINAANLGG